MLSTIIIGPSGVGKTAFVASVQHASNIVSFSSEEYQSHVVPKNAQTRRLFSQSLDIIKSGGAPFAGTEISVAYEFITSLENKERGRSWKHAKASSFA